MRSMSRFAAVVVAALLPGSAMAQQPPLAGTDGADELRGTSGADRIDGRRGSDRIDGRGGRDVIRCGDGRDYVLAERRDVVADDCETVTYRRSLTDEVIDAPADHHGQHGGTAGHLPGSSAAVELVGQLDIEGAAEGDVADVAAHGNHAYLTVRDPEGCSDAGVAVMDISDPTEPVQVGFIEASEGAFPGEGAQVVSLRTPSFRGQVLVFNNELCARGGEAGASLWDVTDPRSPKVLSANTGDADPGGALSRYNQIHSAFAWQQGRRAFMVMVDNEETTDVDILEITDPTRPELLTELDLAALYDIEQPELATAGTFPSVNLHDMVVERVRGTWTMLLSYWDAGWVQLDVDDPRNPILIADSDYSSPDTLLPAVPVPEGNAHQAEFSPGGRFIVGTDEDFSPYRLQDNALRITSGPDAGNLPGGTLAWTVPIERYPDGAIAGPTIYGGLGCPTTGPYGPQLPIPNASTLEADPGEEKVVVLQRGVCFFSEKVQQAQLAGYDAVVIANHHVGAGGGATPDAMLCGARGHEFTPTIAGICVGHRALHLLFGQPPSYEGDPLADSPALGTVGADVRAASQFDGWGYVRLLDRATMREIGAYAIDEALDPAFAEGFGDLSVHEVAVDPRERGLAYLSYYAGGLRVIRYGDDGVREAGHYIHENGNNFWGVEVHRLAGGGAWSNRTLILASDRDSGLWIFRYTGG